MKAPVFIIGNPRSGTTLLRLMMTCHRHIVVPPECGFALWLRPKYQDWRQRDTESRLSSFVADLMRCKKIETWRLNAEDLAEYLRARRPGYYADLASAVYEFYASGVSESCRRWGDKNNYYLDHIAEIKQLYPHAFFLHIVKDGRSVACSYRRLKTMAMDSRYAPKLPSQLEEIAAHWKANIETIRHAFDGFAWRGVHEVRFEDLVSEPEDSLREVCHRLGEIYDPGMLDYHRVNGEQQLEPRELMPWKAKTLLPPLASEAFRYQQELTASECRNFERIASPMLKQYGYI